MKKLNDNTLNLDEKKQVDRLIADMEGRQPDIKPTVRFVARGLSGGEFG